MATIRPLTRDQLARFLGNNQEAIRYFEQLTAQASSDADLIVILFRIAQEIAVEATTALAAANQAQSTLGLLVDEFGLQAGVEIPEPAPDDLTPPPFDGAYWSLSGFPGGTTDFLRADGTFAAPPGGNSLRSTLLLMGA